MTQITTVTYLSYTNTKFFGVRQTIETLKVEVDSYQISTNDNFTYFYRGGDTVAAIPSNNILSIV